MCLARLRACQWRNREWPSRHPSAPQLSDGIVVNWIATSLLSIWRHLSLYCRQRQFKFPNRTPGRLDGTGWAMGISNWRRGKTGPSHESVTAHLLVRVLRRTIKVGNRSRAGGCTHTHGLAGHSGSEETIERERERGSVPETIYSLSAPVGPSGVVKDR